MGLSSRRSFPPKTASLMFLPPQHQHCLRAGTNFIGV